MARETLDLARITEAAVDLLDEVGLVELSTRRLATRLGVRSPTLYWHVRNKAELLDLVAEAISADAFDIDPTRPWHQQLADGLRQFRALLLRHRDAATLLRERPATGPNRLRHIETTVRILLDAGFSTDDAAAISRLLAAHVLDSVPSRPPGDPAPVIAAMADYPSLRRVGPAFGRLSDEDLFELGVEIILAGLRDRLAQA